MARSAGISAFNPANIPNVVGWYRVQTAATATHSVSGDTIVTSVTDVMNGIQATQSNEDRSPDLVTVNGLPGLDNDTDDGDNDFLVFPQHESNNSTNGWGIAGWFNMDNVAGLKTLIAHIIGTGTSLHRAYAQTSGDDIYADIFESNVSARRGRVNNVLTAGNNFICVSFQGDAGVTDSARFKIFLEAVEQNLTFSNVAGSPGVMPATVQAASGTGTFFTQSSTSGLRPWVGTIANNWWILKGHLTVAEQEKLMAFQPPF